MKRSFIKPCFSNIDLLCFILLFRDMYHGIGPLDPERLNVFRTVKEITGKTASLGNTEYKKNYRVCLCMRPCELFGL